MLDLLAQFPTPTKDEAWPVLITLFALIGIVEKGMAIQRHRKGVNVSVQVETASKAELESLKRDMQTRTDTLANRFDMLKDELRKDIGELPVACMKQLIEALEKVNTQLNAQGIEIATLKTLITRSGRRRT